MKKDEVDPRIPRLRVHDRKSGDVLAFSNIAGAALNNGDSVSIAPFVTIGEAADRVIDAMGDTTAESPRLWTMLRAHAHEAKRRGAIIQVIPQGFLVRATAKSEIVTWEQADVGVIERALDRVAPYPEPEIG